MRHGIRSASIPLKYRMHPAENASSHDVFFPRFVRWAILHFVLGFLLYMFRPYLPTVFAFGIALAGLSVLSGKDPRRMAYVLVYIAGAELVWRMTKADVYWEFGKYLTIGLVLLAIFRWRFRLSGMPLFYFVLLTPSIILTLNQFSPALARDAISFNLSGPLALMFCAFFFQNIKLNKTMAAQLALVGILPVLSVSALTLRGILASEQITFSLNSNFATSGGYGPNQVSAILGLGALFCILNIFLARPTGFPWFVMMGLTFLFIAQAGLTFSRGGLYNLAIALPFVVYFLGRGASSSRQQVFMFLFVFGVGGFYFAQDINAFAGGVLFDRFQDLNSTGRWELFLADIQIWQHSPILGVGVGVSPIYRPLYGSAEIAAHNEYSRVLAENGVLGIMSFVILALLCLSAFFRSRNNAARGFVAGLVLWSLAEMAHAAMRVVAISTVITLPLALLDFDETEFNNLKN